MMKPNTRIMGAMSWQFPLKGGPYNKHKYRLAEPLPEELRIPHSTGEARYVKTLLPERKRWPVMYIYDVPKDHHDSDSVSDSRTRMERFGQAVLFGPRCWYRP